MRKSGLIYPLLLLVCWTGLIGSGTYALLSTTYRQQRALQYSKVRGKIVLSQVGTGPMSRRGFDIEYNYVINGVEYTGHRFRYDDHNSAFEWDTAIDEHPRWSAQTVYYDPANPVDSLLAPGIDGGDFLLLLFALPINVVTMMLWAAMWGRLKDLRESGRAGGVPIMERQGLTEAHLGEVSALAAGVYALGVVSFVGAFPVAIFEGFQPSIHLMLVIWGIVFLAGVSVFLWRAFQNWAGFYNLRIDKKSQTLTLPRLAGRKETVRIPQTQVEGVALCRRVSKGPSGLQFSYLPALRCATTTASESVELVSWGWSERKARAFGEWLSLELGKQFVGVLDEHNAVPKI